MTAEQQLDIRFGGRFVRPDNAGERAFVRDGDGRRHQILGAAYELARVRAAALKRKVTATQEFRVTHGWRSSPQPVQKPLSRSDLAIQPQPGAFLTDGAIVVACGVDARPPTGLDAFRPTEHFRRAGDGGGLEKPERTVREGLVRCVTGGVMLHAPRLLRPVIVPQAELFDGLFAQARPQLVEQCTPARTLPLRIIKEVALKNVGRVKFVYADDDLRHR